MAVPRLRSRSERSIEHEGWLGLPCWRPMSLGVGEGHNRYVMKCVRGADKQREWHRESFRAATAIEINGYRSSPCQPIQTPPLKTPKGLNGICLSYCEKYIPERLIHRAWGTFTAAYSDHVLSNQSLQGATCWLPFLTFAQ